MRERIFLKDNFEKYSADNQQQIKKNMQIIRDAKRYNMCVLYFSGLFWNIVV